MTRPKNGKALYPKRIKRITYHLCNMHCDGLGWDACSDDSEGCQIEQARKDSTMTKIDKHSLRVRAGNVYSEVDVFHPNWSECRGSTIVMNRARRIIDNARSTIADLKKAGRSLYRLWSVFKGDYEDRQYVQNLVESCKVFQG